MSVSTAVAHASATQIQVPVEGVLERHKRKAEDLQFDKNQKVCIFFNSHYRTRKDEYNWVLSENIDFFLLIL